MMARAVRKPLQFAAMVLLTQFALLLQLKSTGSSDISLPGCPDNCNGIPIPYPFGIGDRCSRSRGFNVTCDTIYTGTLTPYLYRSKFQIANISIPLGEVRLKMPIFRQCYNVTSGQEIVEQTIGTFFSESSLWLNNVKNKFVVTGCQTLASFTIDYLTGYSVGCISTCNSVDSLRRYGPSCSGVGCCQTAFPKSTQSFLVEFDASYNHSLVYNFSSCSYAMVVETDSFQFNPDYATSDSLRFQKMPVIYDWVIYDWFTGRSTCKAAQTHQSTYACNSDYSVCSDYNDGSGYRCNCSDGYKGNPYLQGPGGCKDIDECASGNPCGGQAQCHNLPGTYRCSPLKCPFGRRSDSNNMCELNLALIIGSCAGFAALSFLGFAIYVYLERKKNSKIRSKYFQQYGGWVLLESIKSNQGLGFTVFTKQQVEQATNNFDSANIIGHGGNGTVYKGILRDQMIAIKRCKIIDESKKKEFGKEMLILSHISHKNIVKLLGCCLEVEVPMLVYEFIPNGTLYQYIHHKKMGSCIPFTTRLRIAYESAEALAYLHTAASPPIFHGDVKSSNILLDKKYTVKVSDFGASVLATTDDEAQIVTFVQGTLGYLDPEYMQTHKLTNKSDVYSFGVVLIEILTGKPIIDFNEPEEERGLAIRFLSAMRENKMQELLDDEIRHQDDLELISEVAALAKECLRMRGEDRPTMKEVADELHRISELKQHACEPEYNHEETMVLLSEGSRHDIEIELTGCSFNVDKEAVESIAVGR